MGHRGDGKVRRDLQPAGLGGGKPINLVNLLLGRPEIAPGKSVEKVRTETEGGFLAGDAPRSWKGKGLPREGHKTEGGLDNGEPFPVISQLRGPTFISLLGQVNNLQELPPGQALVKGEKLGDRVVRVPNNGWKFDVQVGGEPVGRLQGLEEVNRHGISQAPVLHLIFQKRFDPKQPPLVPVMGNALRPVMRQENVDGA